MIGKILDLKIDSDFAQGHVITANMRLLGTPEQAQALMRREIDLNIVRKQIDPKIGDQIQYEFLRDGKNLETSIWMTIKKIESDGNVITAGAVSPRNGQPYSFKILRCQIVEHKPKKDPKIQNEVRAKPVPAVGAFGTGLTHEQILDHVREIKGDTGPWLTPKEPENEELAALKKQVKEFELK